MDDRLPRKLAAILYADVAGYSRLSGDDEDATHRILSEYLDLISTTIRSHHGDVMHYAGDAVLAKFAAVVDAVSSAKDIQEQLGARNANLPEERKVQFRIGVNSGDVIEDRGDIYGDGVNVAARLESLAEPGGICVSDAVRSAVGNKLGLNYADLGEQQVKNIAEAVRAYQIILPKPDVADDSTDTAHVVKPNEPSIAVLPFTNMSSDPEQEFFSDGITEDIITALSKISSLLVIARNSTFIYKGKAIDVKQVGREQGVSYVLEGSVRKAGSRVRITAQLIDAETGHHKWAEHYDRELDDIFALQDELTRHIVLELDVHLRAGEQARFWSSGTENLAAWESFRQARELLDGYRADDVPAVMRLLQKALDLDPEYAAAWCTMAGCQFHIEEDPRNSDEVREQAFAKMLEYAQKALECDPSCSVAYSMLGLYHLNLKNFDEAMNNAKKSVEMEPNHANNLAISAVILSKSGQPGQALDQIRKAIRLCPVYPLWFLSALGQISRLLNRVDDTIEAYSEMIRRNSDHLEGHIGLTEILGELGRTDQAKAAAAQVLRINPDFSLKSYIGNLAYRDPAEITRFAEGLRAAGLPE